MARVTIHALLLLHSYQCHGAATEPSSQQQAIVAAGSSAPPRVLLQVGPPRSATTLQFQTLCAIAMIQHEDNPSSITCDYTHPPSDAPDLGENFVVAKVQCCSRASVSCSIAAAQW